jgi:4-amino-4-deoxy-L-arabinose transferase-like glycosyltransferase
VLGRALSARVALVGIVLLALVLRLWGLDSQLPWQLHPDEGHYVWKAADMAQDGSLNPKYFRNPTLFTYLLLAEYTLLELSGLNLAALAPKWSALAYPSLELFLGRLSSALLGVATVAVVYALGARLLGRSVGLLGALLLAVAFIHVRDSHFATNDVAATFLLSLSVLFSARLAVAGRIRHLFLAALLGGLASSAKYNAGFFVLPLLVAFGAAFRRSALAPGRLAALGAAGALSLLAYLAGTPFTLLAWPMFRDDFLVQQRFARSGWEGQGTQPVSLLYLDAFGQGLGWIGLLLAVAGYLLLIRRRPLAAALLGILPLGYLAFMLTVKLFFVRFALLAVPFSCLAAAFALIELGRLVSGSQRRALLVGGLTVAALVQPLWNDVLHNRLLSRADTRVLAYEWLETHLPPGARIAADEYTVRDRRPRAFLADRARFDLDLANPISASPLDSYRQRGYEYVVVSSFQYQRFGGQSSTYQDLASGALELARFTPAAEGRELPFDIEELYSPFHDLARYERPGPTIVIYGLRR